ncbi:MAG TPA: Fic family protein [Deferrimonas sp.]|jgi:Fic family protein
MKFENRLADIDRLHEEIRGLRPLGKKALVQLREYYKIGLTWASNALEGNSLTESETKVVIEDGITIGGKPLRDHFEAVGHAEAFDLLFSLAKRRGVTETEILKLHRLFFYRIDPKEAGHYRKAPAIITGSTIELPPPSKIKAVMKEFVAGIPERRAEVHPVEFAALLHLRLVTIHPFVDGNGRTARLLMNLALVQDGYPVTIIPPVLRPDYIEALKASNTGDNRPFVNLISNMVYEAQRDYLRLFKALTTK